ncbi:MAG TPA: hypothetical protein VM407_07060 [Acidovorax sp.]|nr:hypothetical protein [Acidovorax sp.]
MTDHVPHIVRADTPQGPCAQLRGRWGAAELGNATQWQAVSARTMWGTWSVMGQAARAAAGVGSSRSSKEERAW